MDVFFVERKKMLMAGLPDGTVVLVLLSLHNLITDEFPYSFTILKELSVALLFEKLMPSTQIYSARLMNRLNFVAAAAVKSVFV